MTNKNRQLGNAGEKGIVERVKAWGFNALRQPLSGQLKDYPADVVIEGAFGRVLVESKVRSLEITTKGKKTWTIDLDWLRKVVKEAQDHAFRHAALFIRPKGTTDHFVVIEEAVYLDLLKRAKW